MRLGVTNAEPIKILLVADDPEAARRIRHLLDDLSGSLVPEVRLVQAQGVEEASGRLLEGEFDALVWPQVPGDGDELKSVRRIIEKSPDLPVLLLNEREHELLEVRSEGESLRVDRLGTGDEFHSIRAAICRTVQRRRAETRSAREIPEEGISLEETIRRKLDEMIVLHAVATAGAEATSEDALIERVTEIIRETLYPDNFGVLLLDEDQGVLYAHASYREGERAKRRRRIPLGKGITGQVALTRRPWRVSDVRREPAYLDVDPRTRSELCVPLKIGERVIGVVNAESSRLNAFTADDERLLTTLAGQLATAIEKVRLFEAERRQRQLAETLTRVGLALSSTLELSELLELICRESKTLFNADAALIWLLQGDDLVGIAGFGINQKDFNNRRIPLSTKNALGPAVVQEGRPIFVNNAPRSKQINQELVKLLRIKSLLGVPLNKGESTIGALMIIDTQKTHAFGPDDTEAAMVLGSHAAIAIDNARLFEEERRRRQEAEILRLAAEGMTSTLDLNQVLDRILVHLEKVVPYDSACIFLVEDDSLRAVAGRKFPHPEKVIGKDYPLEEDALHREVQRTGRPLIIEDVRDDPRFRRWGGTDYVRGWMGVPLLARGKVIGQLTLDSRAVGAYGGREAALAQALANQAAMAIDNARLFEESQRQARALAGLYETALATNSVLVTEALLARLRDQIMQLFSPDSIGVFFYEAGEGEFEVALAVEAGEELQGLVGARVAVEDGGLTGWVIQTRQPLLVEDLQNAPLPVSPRHITRPSRSWLGVPLIARDRLIGVISLQSFRPRAFSNSDRRFLESMASQVAVALENARLYEEARRGVARREALNTIVSAAAGATDLTALLEIALDQTLLALGLKAGGIWVRGCYVVRDLPDRIGQALRNAAQHSGLDLLNFPEPIVVADWHQQPKDSPLGEIGQAVSRFGVRASLVVPIRANGRHIGGIAVVVRERRFWSQEEIALAEAVGNHVGAAIERLRLFEQTRVHARLMEHLVPLSEALNRPLTVSEVIRVIGEGVLSLAGVSRAAVYLRHPDDSASCPWSLGISPAYLEQVTTRLKDLPGGQLLQSTQPVLIADVERLPDGSLLRQLAQREGIRSVGLWPLVYEGQVIAAVGCYYDGPHAWADVEQEVMLAFARQAAVALQNARLFKAERQRTEELARSNALITALSRVAATIVSSSDPEQVMRAVGDELKGFNIECFVALMDSESQGLFVRYSSVQSDLLKRAEALTGLNLREFRLSPEIFPPYEEIIEHRREVFISELAPLARRMLKGVPRPTARLALKLAGVSRKTAAMYIPLAIEDRVIGLLGIWGDDLRQADLAAVSLFGNQLAIAIENARLYNLERKRRLELESLRQASLQLASSLESEHVLETILEQALKLISADDAHIFLYDGERLMFGAAMWAGERRKAPFSEPRPNGITYTVARTGERVVVPDVNGHPLFQDDPWGGAIVGLPICKGGQVLGVMNVAFSAPHLFNDDELRVLELLADQAAIALDNAHSYEVARAAFEETEQRVRELSVLFSVSQSLASTALNLEDIANTFARQFVEVLGMPECSISLLEPQGGGVLRTVADYFFDPGQKRIVPEETGLTYRLEDYPATARVLETLRPLIVRADDPEAEPAELAYMEKYAITTLVILPLAVKGQGIGVVEIEAYEERADFTQDQLNLMMILANQAAIAVDNARLLEALQARVAELSVIADASGALREAGNISEIGQMLAEQAVKLVQADAALLLLMDEDRRRLFPNGVVGLEFEPSGFVIPADEGIAGRVIRSGQPYRSPELSHDPITVMSDVLADMGPGLCVPLRTSTGEVIGTLLVARRNQPGGDRPDFKPQEERLVRILAEIGGNALQRAHTFEELEAAYLQSVLSLARAMDARDSYTGDHSLRLASWAEAVAREMGCSDAEIQDIHWAALLHDIGKIGVPDNILRKPESLTEDEWVIMRRHPIIGAEIVSPVKKLTNVAPLIRAHQERYDGKGYPDGLRGEEIPLGARILAAVDAFSAMTDERVYRKARTYEEAMAELQRNAGTQFDPQVIETLLRILRERMADNLP